MARGRRIFHPTRRSRPRSVDQIHVRQDIHRHRRPYASGTTSIAPRSTATRESRPSRTILSVKSLAVPQYSTTGRPKTTGLRARFVPAQYGRGYDACVDRSEDASSSERSARPYPGRSGTLTRLRPEARREVARGNRPWRSVLRCSRRRLRARRGAVRIQAGDVVISFSRVVRRARTYHDLEDDLPVVWLTQSEILAVEAP